MGFPKLFSKREQPALPVTYDLPEKVRIRLIMVLKRYAQYSHGRQPVEAILSVVQLRLTEEYGYFTPSRNREMHPAVNHFKACSTKEAIDFIEAIFTSMMDSAAATSLVDEFNKIFREESVGYELTPLSERIIKGGAELHGHRVDAIEYTYPIIRRREDTPQEESMSECLNLLTDPIFKVANEQFLKAHQHYRAGEWDQTIAYCGSALESVLKAVLTKNGKTFGERATASALIETCVQAGIFPQVYQNGLIGVANIRNALSDATHGRAPATQITPEQKHAEHLLYVTAANIVFVAR